MEEGASLSAWEELDGGTASWVSSVLSLARSMKRVCELNFSTTRAFKLLVLTGLIFAFACAQAQLATPAFAQTVLGSFDTWDSDHNGRLTQVEVDSAVLNPQFHGAQAAALAALHTWIALEKDEAPVLDKAWFQSYRSVPLRIPKGTPTAEAKERRKEYAATPGSLQGSYARSLKRLSKLQRPDLYEEGTPTLSDIRQGALGDCYMLAPLGAVVHRDAKSVEAMIHQDPAGYTVTFGDGKVVHVAQLTDTELALGGSSLREGLWVRVIEKAYGSRKFDDDGPHISRDTMNGGSTGVAGRAFTGHPFRSIALIGDYKKDVPSDKMQEILEQLRQSLPSAIAENRLVLAGTPKREMPKSISPNHAYAILAFDTKSDVITLWNPHGNDSQPKGPEGAENGFTLKGGVFSMPLDLFAHTFGHVLIESKGQSISQF